MQINFRSHEEVECIASLLWSINSTPITFKLWNPLFNVTWERLEVVPISVRLPILQSNMWNDTSFMHLGNSLGVFTKSGYSFEEKKDMSIAHILVHLDMWKRIYETMNIGIEVERLHFLDYEGVSFQCNRYQKHVHLVCFSNLLSKIHTPRGGVNKKMKVASNLSMSGYLKVREAVLIVMGKILEGSLSPFFQNVYF